MLSRLKAHLAESNLIPPKTSVLVGYSGGPDSTCLLHLLRLAGVDVVAAHLHHGQRPEGEMELKLCEAFCGELEIPFVSGRADVPRMAREMRIGLEEAGRKARYTFFDEAATRAGCGLIATAHTRTDLTETILLNLARGSGLAGLAGIPQRRGNVIRPLLPFSRHETRAYCAEQGLWTHDDPANVDLSFSRARIRHRVIPELQAINARAEDAICRLAETAGEEDRFLNGMAAAALEQCERELNGALRFLTIDVEAAFDAVKLGAIPPALFKRALRLAAAALGGSLDYDQVAIVAKSFGGGETGSVTAEGGEVVVEWTQDLLSVRQLTPTTPFRYPLTLPGETLSDEFGWAFTAYETDEPPARIARASLETVLDRSKIVGSLHFRTAQPGDQMQPLGFRGHRKLADLLSEAKLTQAARARLPIVCDMVGPIWAPGVCLDDRARSSKDSRGGIVLRFSTLNALASHNEGNGV